MTFSVTRKFGRPSWMTPYGEEGFGDVFFDRLWPEWRRDLGEDMPPTMDFYEKDGKYYLTAELPGLKKDDISASFHNGFVTIRAHRESKKEEEGAEYHVREIRHGSFSRTFRLPGDIDEDKVGAHYENGILTLVMPYNEELKGKKVKIH